MHLTQLSSLEPVTVSHIYSLEDLMTSAALSYVPPPVSEPAAQCQSGSALLSICLKRHHYNQEPVWFSHFGFCHVTLWILIGMESSCPLRDCKNTFHAFTQAGERQCPNITLDRTCLTPWGNKSLYHCYICTISFTRLRTFQSLLLYYSECFHPPAHFKFAHKKTWLKILEIGKKLKFHKKSFYTWLRLKDCHIDKSKM